MTDEDDIPETVDTLAVQNDSVQTDAVQTVDVNTDLESSESGNDYMNSTVSCPDHADIPGKAGWHYDYELGFGLHQPLIHLASVQKVHFQTDKEDSTFPG